jgi:hypothetical protein
MPTLEAPVTSAPADKIVAGKVPGMTWGWVLRRSALLVLILAGGITCALWLYAAASPDETGSVQSEPPVVARNI